MARLGAQLPSAIADLAQSARAVDQQQVKLGEWKQTLLQDPTMLMEAYLASAQGQSQRALVAPK